MYLKATDKPDFAASKGVSKPVLALSLNGRSTPSAPGNWTCGLSQLNSRVSLRLAEEFTPVPSAT